MQTYAATALVVIAVLNRLPIKLLPQRGAGRRHASTQVQVRLRRLACAALRFGAALRWTAGPNTCLR